METVEKENKKNENQELYRVVIGREENEILETMLAKVTDGFDAGSVNKSDVASWLIANAASSFGDVEVKAVRKLHFDVRKILGTLARDSKAASEIPESVKKAILEHYGLIDGPKRRSQEKGLSD